MKSFLLGDKLIPEANESLEQDSHFTANQSLLINEINELNFEIETGAHIMRDFD